MIVEEVKVAPVGSVLPPVPGTKPADGAVLLSTFLPTDGWLRPDWEELETHLPFGKADGIKLKQESPLPPTPSLPNVPVGPSIAPRPRATPKLLNLGAKSFLPLEGDLHAVTIRLSDINDRVWRRVKWIMEEVERAEMAADGETEPKLPAADSTPTIGNSADFAQPALSASASTDPSRPPSAKVIPLPRSTYLHKKRSRFQSLLRRVPPRPFLRYRLPQPIPSLIEATSDKWAPRPYPISTKPLYTTDDADLQLHLPLPPTPSSPGTSKKRRRKEDEPEVTFEMPVSLDALDERVAEGAMRSLGARGRGRGRGRGGGGGKVDDGRRRYGKRAVPGRVCEGCGGEGLKIWRRGPGGKGTRK